MGTPTTVSEIMTRDVTTLREEENLSTLLGDMARAGFRHLPVVDGKRLVGLVSHRDLLRISSSSLDRDSLHKAIDRQHKDETFVAAIMTRDVDTVGPDTPLAEAATKLLAHKYGCLPVVDEQQQLLGIVTEKDFLELLVQVLSTQ